MAYNAVKCYKILQKNLAGARLLMAFESLAAELDAKATLEGLSKRSAPPRSWYVAWAKARRRVKAIPYSKDYFSANSNKSEVFYTSYYSIRPLFWINRSIYI